MEIIIRHAAPKTDSERRFRVIGNVNPETKEATVNLYGSEYTLLIKDEYKSEAEAA
jgi:hypothetical protein